ncbi:hypothetical protein Bbelb_090410 [Branchiostoma belcheri]|nr:hypothetical protein Bbelb_090410 [Branchiostoma belcheri]
MTHTSVLSAPSGHLSRLINSTHSEQNPGRPGLETRAMRQRVECSRACRRVAAVQQDTQSPYIVSPSGDGRELAMETGYRQLHRTTKLSDLPSAVGRSDPRSGWYLGRQNSSVYNVFSSVLTTWITRPRLGRSRKRLDGSRDDRKWISFPPRASNHSVPLRRGICSTWLERCRRNR